MTGRGTLTRAPNRRLRLMLAAHAVWLAVICLLGAWWAKLLLIQARRIEDLEKAAGVADPAHAWARTQHMLFWEGGTFAILLLAISLLLFWLYWRDLLRTRGLQAFFASVTHELKTPLTSIRLQAESIADSFPAGSEDRKLVERLLEDTTRLEGQVEKTLELARVEGGGPVYVQSLRLRPCVERSMRTWEDTHSGRLQIRSEVQDLSVRGDAAAIQMILRNLIENSVRHSGKQPVIVSLTTESRSGRVALRYKDNGDGFDGDASRLGSIFHRGPSSQGAGVGLYLIRVLMERMGGYAEFQAGRGFEAELWFRPAQAQEGGPDGG